jgi:hypothetical protein
MASTPRLTHDQRERIVLTDLETHFPNFSGQPLSWTKVPDRQDPPDFLSRSPDGPIGLELVEWLDGSQMGPAKKRESQREQMRRILTPGWKKEYQPKHFCGAFPSLLGTERIASADEQPLRQEFFACAADVDRAWASDSDHWGNSHYRTEFAEYPLLGKYFVAIRYIGGEPHGLCWIGEQGDGGAFDPTAPVETLKQALDHKLGDYSTPAKHAHLKTHNLTELYLLVHGGFNVYAYNTPSGHLSLEEIVRRGADYYAAHAQRFLFNRAWFFHSLDAAPDDVDQQIGFAPGEGRVRWLAQLWPDFRIYLGSVGR